MTESTMTNERFWDLIDQACRLQPLYASQWVEEGSRTVRGQ